jgi:hypothetical protein
VNTRLLNAWFLKILVYFIYGKFEPLNYPIVLNSSMSEDEQLEQLINQTLDGSLATIPAHLQEIEQNIQIIQAEHPKEFVYGLIVGAALTTGITGLVQIKKSMPTAEDQIKIRDMIYKKIPQIRERIFG